MRATIEWYVWKPSRSDRYLGMTLDEEDCRYAVHNDFGVSFHQCLRKGKIDIQGYLFCTQHSKKVNRGLSGKVD